MGSSDGSVPDAAGAPATTQIAQLLETTRRLVAVVAELAQDQLQLLALESERAGQALARMAALGLAAGLLVAGSWLGLSLALVFWLLEWGLRTSLALLLASGMNLLGLWLVLQGLQRESAALGFPGTLRSLQGLRKPLPPGP